jgi:hypothetical protein
LYLFRPVVVLADKCHLLYRPKDISIFPAIYCPQAKLRHSQSYFISDAKLDFVVENLNFSGTLSHFVFVWLEYILS